VTRALLLAALAAGCGAPRAEPARTTPIRLRLDALDGGEVDTAGYRGRVVVLHLFTTDSTAAQLDADQLDQLHQREPRRAVVIAIAMDKAEYSMINAWRRGMAARYLVAVADDGMRRGAGPLGLIRTVPTTVVLDRAGRAVHRLERPLERGELARLVAPLFAAK
jgi:peroxiredoxin